MIAGPCVVCGRTNYELSMGGPTICPRCDCRPPTMREIREREERDQAVIDALRAQDLSLRELLRKASGTLHDCEVAITLRGGYHHEAAINARGVIAEIEKLQ